MEANQLYTYDETSPTCLRWAVDIYSGKWKNFKNVSVGDVAGGLGKSGYYQVRNNKVLKLVHRMIWELMNGPLKDTDFIDHFDGNKTNNKISNLRLVERPINARNCKIREDNSSGHKGVTLLTNTLRSGNRVQYWSAFWSTNGKNYNKRFSVKILGFEAAKEAAISYRKNIMKELNDNGSGYTERHLDNTST